MALPFYFHWIDIGTTQASWLAASTWNAAYAVNDEQVASFLIEHSEGQIPSLTIDVANPHIGLLAPGRPTWAWFSRDNNGTPEPLFFGRLVGIPTDLLGQSVTLHFTARSINYVQDKQLSAEPLKVRPYYDPVFLALNKRDDPDAILEGYSSLWHVDRLTLGTTTSDILFGEDGTAIFNVGDIPYDGVKINLQQAPLVAVGMAASVSWTQASTGYVNMGVHTFDSYSGDGILNEWPKPLNQLGSGWSVAYSNAIDARGVQFTLTPSFSFHWQNNEKEHNDGDWLTIDRSRSYPQFLPGTIFLERDIFDHNITGLQDPHAVDKDGDPAPINRPSSREVSVTYVPQWRVNTSLILRYDAARQRTEKLQFILSADTQPIITSPLVTQDTEEITLTGSDVGLPIINQLNWTSIAGQSVGIGQYIFPNNPTLPGQTSSQVATTAGIAGFVQPIFSNVAGQTTLDGTVVWTSLGSSPPPEVASDWTLDTLIPLGDIILPRVPIYLSWITLVQGGLQQIPQVGSSVNLYQIVQDTNNKFQQCTLAGVTGIRRPSFGSTYGQITNDGSVQWTCIGPALPLGSVYFLCTHAGTTGETIPFFNNTQGANTTDGTVVWTSIGTIEVPVGGYPSNTPSRWYFPTDRGNWSIEYLLCLARARLRARSRAVEITFDCRMERAMELSCRMNAEIFDPRLPGGRALGKIISYTIKGDGDRQEFIGTVKIGCSVGYDSILATVTGTPTYVEVGYVTPGYQRYDGIIILPTAENDIGYTPPAQATRDDGLIFPLDYNQSVAKDAAGAPIDRVHGTLASQITALESALDSAVIAAHAGTTTSSFGGAASSLEQQIIGIATAQNSVQVQLANHPIWYELQLKPINGGPFIDEYSIETTKLTLPMMIDLGTLSVVGSTTGVPQSIVSGAALHGTGKLVAIGSVSGTKMSASFVGVGRLGAAGGIFGKTSAAHFVGTGSLVAKKTPILHNVSLSFAGDGVIATESSVTYAAYSNLSSSGYLFTASDDPNFSSTKVLMGFEGSNGATGSPGMTDESASARGTATVVGNAQITTAQSKFGSSSLVLDGVNDYITFLDSDDWNLGTSPFTMEGWFRFSSPPSNAVLVSHWSSDWAWYFASGNLRFRINSGTDYAGYTWSPTLNQWYHICCEKNGSAKIRMYIDGVMQGSSTSTAAVNGNSTTPLAIGSLRADGFTTFDMNGFIDELRITVGAARYDSDSGFNIPTSAFPRANVPNNGVNATVVKRGAAPLSGSGTLALTTVIRERGSAAFVGTGSLIADATVQAPVIGANFTGSGALVTKATILEVASSSFAGVGTMTASSVSDPYWNSVVLLCGFDGTNGSTSIVDESSFARTLTVNGNAQISTAQSVFGGSSLLLDGTGDYVTAPASTDFDFSGQFTIEMRVRNATSSDGDAIYVSKYSATAADKAWAFGDFSSEFYFWFFNSSGTERDTNYTFIPTINTWYNICVDRDASGVIRLYQDGVFKVKATWNEAIRSGATPQPLYIGRLGGFTTYDVNGNIDELRITKGVCRYGTDAGYTIATAAFPRG